MEVVNNWRLKDIRYGLRVNLDAHGNVLGNLPQGIKEHVESQNKQSIYGLMAVGLMKVSEEALS